MTELRFKGNQVFLGKRKVGWLTLLRGKVRVFISPRKRGEHFFRMFKGWGISEELLGLLENNEFVQIQIRIKGEPTLCADVKLWRAKGIPYHKRGFEPQIILPEKHFLSDQAPLTEFAEAKQE